MARTVARRQRAKAAALPQWVAPQLTQLVDAAPYDDDWLHEIKYDGYRMMARFDRGAVKLLTRTGLDWTHKYSGIASAVASLPAHMPRNLPCTQARNCRVRSPILIYYLPRGQPVRAEEVL